MADFGFITHLPEHVGSTSLITVVGAVGLAGTWGIHLAPKFSDGKRGVKSDVYSYGIVSCGLCQILGVNVYLL